MGKLFYRDINEGLKKELEYRKEIFSNKTPDFYNFLSSPYVQFKFIRRFDQKEYVINNANKENISDVYDFDFKNIPNPTIQSLSVYNEGRYGSIRKADMVVKLYHVRQLSDLESYLMIPGNTVEIKFGLSHYATNLNEKEPYYNLTLKTNIHNFSYSMDEAGGIEFTINSMGEGLFAASLDMNTKMNPLLKNVDKTEEEGERTNNLLSYLFGLVDDLSKRSFSGYDENTGVCRHHISPTWEYETTSNFDSKNNEYVWYVTLNGLISIINEHILRVGERTDISYDGDAISTYDKNIISTDPTKIVFPDSDMGNYNKGGEGVAYYSNFGSIPKVNKKFKDKDNVNLGYTLISIDFIANIFEDISDQDDEENVPVKKLLNKIFDSIYENSGNIYDMTLMMTEGENEENIKLSIIDSNYIDDEESNNEPYVFETMNMNNILKSFSIESELPDKMATAMYSGGATSKNINPKVYSFFTRDSETYYDPSIPNPVYSAEEWEEMKNEVKMEEVKKDIRFYANKISKNGVEKNTKNSLRSALKSYKNLSTGSKWNSNLLYPLNLQLSLHGIVGFRFGDIITVDYIPDRYLNNSEVKIVFMITKINHTIDGNEWTTELETQCRIRS